MDRHCTILILDPPARIQIVKGVSHYGLVVVEASVHEAEVNIVEFVVENPLLLGILFDEAAIGNTRDWLDSTEIRADDDGIRMLLGYIAGVSMSR